jgi:long-chain acyl-CoA synthetase
MNPDGSPDTITGLLADRVHNTPDADAFYCRSDAGAWLSATWSQVQAKVAHLTVAFQQLGLRRNDRLAIIARTSLEWQIAEFAGLLVGAVVVGVEPHAPAELIEHILRHSGAVAAIVDDRQSTAKIPEAVRANLRFLLTLDEVAHASMGSPENDGETPVTAEPGPGLASQPAGSHARSYDSQSEQRQGEPWQVKQGQADRAATLIYTSGTTGRPKAIEYSHRQLLIACGAIARAFPEIGPGDSVLCWLPMAHLFQRMMNLVAVARGARVYFVENPREVMQAIRQVQPSVFVAVPRFYERLYEGIQEKISQQPVWLAWLVRLAMRVGAAHARCQRAGGRLPLWLVLTHTVLDAAVLSRIRAVVGRRMRFMITGSAPTPPWLLEFFHGIGLLVLEAYGISENAVPMAANRLQDYRFGSVGKPFPENEFRFGDDGEILVRGPGVFGGYFRDAEQQARFTQDGYLETGDIGHFDADGFLYLTGRKAEIIKTSTGRRISPAAVEAVYAQSPYIDQVVVVGEGRKYLVGLIVLRKAQVERRLGELGIAVPAAEEALEKLPQTRQVLCGEIEKLGGQLAPQERLADFTLLSEPLSLARGEITPTFKVRRSRVVQSYADEIETLYREPTAMGSGNLGSPR